MEYDVIKYNLRWRMITMLAGYTIADWLYDFIPNPPGGWIGTLLVVIKVVVMLGLARWFRRLLYTSPPVVVGQIRSSA